MLRRFIVLSILAFVCFAQHPVWDVCFDLASANITGSYIVPGVARPFCGYDDVCKNIRNRANPHVPITCNEAFESLTNKNNQRFQEPPIVSFIGPRIGVFIALELEFVESTRETREQQRNKIQSDLARSLIDSLGNTTQNIVDRIFGTFPRLVYDESYDGDMLRNLTETARLLSRDITLQRTLSVHPITIFVMQTSWMRQFTMCINTMMWHVAAQFLNQTDKHIVAMAPWLHAYMKTCFYLGIFYPDLYDHFGWLLRDVSTVKPLYTSENTWYMLLSEFVGDHLALYRNRNITWDMVEDMFNAPVPRNGDYLLPFLVSNISEYLSLELTGNESQVDQRGMQIERLAYAMEFLFCFDSFYVGSSMLNHDDVQTIRRFLDLNSTHMDTATMESIVRIFKPIIPLRSRMDLTMSLLKVNANIPISAAYATRDFVIVYNGRELMRDYLVYNLLKLTKYDFTLSIRMQIAHATPPDWETVANDMILAFLSPRVGLFQRINSTDNNGTIFTYYKMKPIYHPNVARNHLAFGRLLGILFQRLNPYQVLNRYIKPPRENATIFETLFFESRIIRHGFYDVYVADSIERDFQDGLELCTALATL